MFLHGSVILFEAGVDTPQNKQPHPQEQTTPLRSTGNERAVRILLECNLVSWKYLFKLREFLYIYSLDICLQTYQSIKNCEDYFF